MAFDQIYVLSNLYLSNITWNLLEICFFNALHMDFDNTIITIASNTFCLESFKLNQNTP